MAATDQDACAEMLMKRQRINPTFEEQGPYECEEQEEEEEEECIPEHLEAQMRADYEALVMQLLQEQHAQFVTYVRANLCAMQPEELSYIS